MLEIVDRRPRCQISCNQRGLYSTAICRHDHSSRIANGHDPIRIGPGKRPVNGKTIANHRSFVSADQPFRRDRILLNETSEEIAYLPVSPDVWFPDPDSNVGSSLSLGNYPPISAWGVSRIPVHLRNILLDVEVGHQILNVRGDRIGTRVSPFRKAGSLCGLTWITVCGDDNVAMNRFFACRTNPASLIIREKVGLDTDVDIRTMASSNISQATLENMPIENVSSEWKLELMSPRTYHTNGTTCRIYSLWWRVDHVEILDSWEKLLHLGFDRKIFAAPDRRAENLLFLEDLHFQAFLRQIDCCRKSTRPTANDDNIILAPTQLQRSARGMSNVKRSVEVIYAFGPVHN